MTLTLFLSNRQNRMRNSCLTPLMKRMVNKIITKSARITPTSRTLIRRNTWRLQFYVWNVWSQFSLCCTSNKWKKEEEEENEFREDAKNVPWNLTLTSNDVNVALFELNNNILMIANKHFTVRKIRVTKPLVPWITEQVKGFWTFRNYYNRRYINTGYKDSLRSCKYWSRNLSVIVIL